MPVVAATTNARTAANIEVERFMTSSFGQAGLPAARPTPSAAADIVVGWLLQPLEQVEVVAVGVLEADHARTPGLVRGRATEDHADPAQRGVERVDIADREADVIDARRIAEEAELAADRHCIRRLRREQEQLHCPRRQHDAAVVAVCLGKAQCFVERNGSRQVAGADADIIDASHHAPPFELAAIGSRYWERRFGLQWNRALRATEKASRSKGRDC